jgi:Tol biopolymer transport system component
MIEKPGSHTRSGVWLLLNLILAAVTLSSCVYSDARHSVFTFRMEDGGLIWVSEPAGIPVWSPTDDTVAWGNEDGLYLRHPDDVGSRRVSASPVAGVPGWSPDGERLAYIDRDRASLIVVDVASGAEELAQPLDRRRGDSARFSLLTLGGPSWAPDGSLIAYVCWDGAGDEICLIGPDGRRWRQLTRLERATMPGESVAPQTSLAASNAGPPAWSPEGDSIAVAAYPERPGAPTGVFLVDLDEGLGRRVSSLQPNSVISWSPDGDSIVFSAFRRGRSDVFRVVLANSTQQRVTEGLPEPSRNPAVSPDGSHIAVETGGEIAVLGQQGPLQTFRVAGLRSSYPSWSADGAAVAIVAGSDQIANYN